MNTRGAVHRAQEMKGHQPLKGTFVQISDKRYGNLGCFELVQPSGKALVMCAETDAETDAWMKALHNNCTFPARIRYACATMRTTLSCSGFNFLIFVQLFALFAVTRGMI